MKVFTWLSSDQYLPNSLRAQARIMLNDGSWHPVIIHGETEEEAAQTAKDWWATALEKIAKKHAPKKATARADADPSLTGAYRRGSPGDVTPAPIPVEDPGDVV